MSEPRLTNDDLKELRRPFPPEAIKFKGQSANANRSKAMVVPYIDARLVIARLNHVLHSDWQPTYEAAGKGLWCHLSVGGVERSDIGVNDSPREDTRLKGTVSDALKRAAVLFGVGESVYSAPSLWLPAGDNGKVTIVVRDNKVKGIYLNDAGEATARETYAKWLEEHGTKEFGEPLGHGAVADAAGLEADETGDAPGEGEAAAEAPPERLVDFEADQLRMASREIYDEIKKLKGGRTKLPPARFQERLREVSTSHDSLREYAAELRTMVDELKGEG